MFWKRNKEPQVHFLFIDDTYNKEINFNSLTAILIPLNSFEAIRDDFYFNIQEQFIKKNDGINLSPPILHGCELLQGTLYDDDKIKFNIFESVTSIVNKHSIKIFKRGLLEDKVTFKNFKEIDHSRLKMVLPIFLEFLDPFLKDIKIIPVMDSVNTEISKIFSGQININEILRRTLPFEDQILKNTQNIYGEVFYANSKYSTFIQLTDLVSYLLQCWDYKYWKKDYKDYKKRIIQIAEKINPDLVKISYTEIKMNL